MDISKLLEIMAALRDREHGCPWDLEQDFSTIAPYTIEEAYEVADAIEREALDELPGELGDLLFQVVYHAQLGKELGAFDFETVLEGICEKLIRRHPHVFADASAETAAEQSEAWERHKHRERGNAGQSRVLDGIARGLPALSRSVKLGQRASRVGFDWPDRAGIRQKVGEELDELDAAIAQGETAEIEAEIGDLLFAVANLCRHLGLDPEHCLRGANRRFSRRFAYVEDRVGEAGKSWTEHDLDELEAYWRRAKQHV